MDLDPAQYLVILQSTSKTLMKNLISTELLLFNLLVIFKTDGKYSNKQENLVFFGIV